MKVAIAADHAGFPLKEWLISELEREGHELIDLGTHDTTPSDYPDHARELGGAITRGEASPPTRSAGFGRDWRTTRIPATRAWNTMI
jgi:ribose 5-phosphate isomerase B